MYLDFNSVVAPITGNESGNLQGCFYQAGSLDCSLGKVQYMSILYNLTLQLIKDFI